MTLAESRPVGPPASARPADLLGIPHRAQAHPGPVAGSVSMLVEADGCVLVVLHGAVDGTLTADVRELVDDIVTGAVEVAGRPVRVLAEQVTRFELLGVWLLLELRRAAKPSRVTLVRPADVVRAAVALHDLRGIHVED